MTSCLPPWMMKHFQNEIYSYGKEICTRRNTVFDLISAHFPISAQYDNVLGIGL